MENKIYRIGSVLNYSGITVLVVGYDFTEEDGYLSPAYKVVLYPQGYTGEIKLVPANEVELIQEGYASVVSDQTLAFFQRCADASDKVKADELKQLLHVFYYGIGEVE